MICTRFEREMPMLPFMKIPAAAIAALVLVTLPACSGNGVQKFSATDPVEKVNGAPITRADLDRAVKALLAQGGAPKTLPPETMKKATDAALNQLTSAELLYQAAQKLEIKDLDKQVSGSVARNRAGYPSEAEFQKALQGVGLTLQEMRELVRKDIVINNFIEKRFAPQGTVSETEVKKFYHDNKEKSFTKGESIRVSHILVGVAERATPETKKQAQEKAVSLLKRVKAGEEFAAIARKESTSPTKDQGGDLGVLGRGQTVPLFEKAAFALKSGEISDVVETQFGYHIIKVTQKIKPSTDRYEDVKVKITGYLKREKIRNLVTAYVEELRGKAKIERV
jgi:peptidyl-prolyl cis-trans isomerase C